MNIGPDVLQPVSAKLPDTKFDSGIDISKRRFLIGGGITAVVVLTIGAKGCGQKISFYVSTVIGSLETLSPLLPNASQLITKAISIAKAFDEAYRAGKFADSVSLFTNLGEIVLQIAGTIGVASPPILLAIAVGRVALNAIASILKSHMSDPTIAGLVNSRSDAAARRQKAMIERMADEKMIQAIVAEFK